MVRILALGFGLVTALAVAGSMTPTGQAMLGLRHPVEQTVPVTVIQDAPAAIPAPTTVRPFAAPAATGPAPTARPSVVTSQARPAAPQARPSTPQARPNGHEARQAPSQPQAAPQGIPGGLAGVANILLNLPQVLDQTHVGPNRGGGSDSWSESRPSDSDSGPVKVRHRHHEEQPHKGPGDDN